MLIIEVENKYWLHLLFFFDITSGNQLTFEFQNIP